MANCEIDTNYIVDLSLQLEVMAEDFPLGDRRPYMELAELVANTSASELDGLFGKLNEPMRTIYIKARDELDTQTLDEEIDRSKKFRKTCRVGGCR